MVVVGGWWLVVGGWWLVVGGVVVVVVVATLFVVCVIVLESVGCHCHWHIGFVMSLAEPL